MLSRELMSSIVSGLTIIWGRESLPFLPRPADLRSVDRVAAASSSTASAGSWSAGGGVLRGSSSSYSPSPNVPVSVSFATFARSMSASLSLLSLVVAFLACLTIATK